MSQDDCVRGEDALRERYPRQFVRPISLEVGNGWLGPIEEMLTDVDKVLMRCHKRIAWSRIHSKYATLRADFESPEYAKAWGRRNRSDRGVLRVEIVFAMRTLRRGQVSRLKEVAGSMWPAKSTRHEIAPLEPGTV